jgi:hypothetical protein
MLLVELAAQGVKGFSPSVRLALKSGYTILKSPGDLPAPLSGLMSALCYPDGRASDASFLAPGQKTGRAGFAFQTPDGTVLRVIRDLGGAGALMKLNTTSAKFEPLTTDSQEIGQLIREQLKFPQRTEFEMMATLLGNQVPSRRPRRKRIAAQNNQSTSDARAALFSMPRADFGSPDVEETKARIALLEAELVTAKQAAELQFKLDGVVGDIYKYESRLKSLADAEERVRVAQAEVDSALSPDKLGLPDDIIDRVTRASQERKRYAGAREFIENERRKAVGEPPRPVSPIYKDNRFIGAVAVGLVLLGAASMLQGSARALALLAIPAFSFAGLLALRFVEELQHFSREKAKLEVFEVREKKLKDEFELGNTLVARALELTGAATDEEFLTTMARASQVQPRLAEAKLEHEAVKAQGEVQESPEKIALAKIEQDRLNVELSKLAHGFVREPREIEREMGMLKAQLAPPAPVKNSDDEGDKTDKSIPFEDPTSQLLSMGADLFGSDVPTFWTVVKDRTVQYLGALTDKRCSNIEVDGDGFATIHTAQGIVNAGELPGKDLDLYFLSLKLTLAEKYLTNTKVPFVVEDSFGTFIDASKIPLFTRMLKHIATLTQVLHVTGKANPATEFVQA